jgi:hypothetical protein
MLVLASCKSGSFRLLSFESKFLVYRDRASLLFMSVNGWFFLFYMWYYLSFSFFFVFSCCFATA